MVFAQGSEKDETLHRKFHRMNIDAPPSFKVTILVILDQSFLDSEEGLDSVSKSRE